MDSDGDVDSEWLLATTRAVVRATGEETPAAIADAVTAALGAAAGFSWLGYPGVRPGVVRVRAASGSVDSPLSLSLGEDGTTADSDPEPSAETATDRALQDGIQTFDSLAENREYRRLSEEYGIPEATTGISVLLGGEAESDGVLHWYGTRDLTSEQVRGTVADLSELVADALAAAEQCRELDRERERLEALRSTISHDLGNPLNLGAGRLDLARSDCESEHLDHVERAFEQIDDLVDEGLTFVQAGKPIDAPERLSLAEVARDCWEHVAEERASLSVADLSITADSERLRRILTELFENALVHNDGAIQVRIEPLADGGGFAVVDTGDGIPEKHREYVFDRGYTTESDRDGNGLAIVEAVARAHGWEVRLGESDDGARVEILTERW